MNVLALDIATHTGWAYFRCSSIKTELLHSGCINLDLKDIDYQRFDDIVMSKMIKASELLVDEIYELLGGHKFEVNFIPMIVIERINLGRQRSVQALLHLLHWKLIERLLSENIPFVYLDPSQWRKLINLRMTKDDKKNNKQVKSKLKRGKITKKHLSVRWANERFGLKLKLKDNDISDAIGIGLAYINMVK